MIDGDRLTALFSLFVMRIFDNFSKTLKEEFIKKINLGIICTAYSNGGFMKYIREKISFPLIIAKTGIKYLYIKAKNFDISILFESNGHGGINFNNKLMGELQKLNCFASSSKDAQFLEMFNIFLSMFNQVFSTFILSLMEMRYVILLFLNAY